MKFPLWLVTFLIIISLVFAGFTAYKLYRAEALSPPTPQEVISQAVEAVPPAEKQKGPLVAAQQAASVPPEASPSQTQAGRIAEGSHRRPVSESSPQVPSRYSFSPEPGILKKIGSVGVLAGEITEVALTTS